MNLREFFLENFASDQCRWSSLLEAWRFSAKAFTCFDHLRRASVFPRGNSWNWRPHVKQKKLSSVPSQAAQILQDFGTGGLLLWPLLNLGKDVDQTWDSPPRFPVFFVGAFLFGLGWAIRYFTQRESVPS